MQCTHTFLKVSQKLLGILGLHFLDKHMYHYLHSLLQIEIKTIVVLIYPFICTYEFFCNYNLKYHTWCIITTKACMYHCITGVTFLNQDKSLVPKNIHCCLTLRRPITPNTPIHKTYVQGVPKNFTLWQCCTCERRHYVAKV